MRAFFLLALDDFQRNIRVLRTAPFSRPRWIEVSGVERHGCRESHDGPGMARRGVPLKLRFNEGIFRPKRKTGWRGKCEGVIGLALGRVKPEEAG